MTRAAIAYLVGAVVGFLLSWVLDSLELQTLQDEIARLEAEV